MATPTCGFGGASFFGQPEMISDSGAIKAIAERRLPIERGFFVLFMFWWANGSTTLLVDLSLC